MQYIELLEACKRSGQYKVLDMVKDAMPFVFDLAVVNNNASIEDSKQVDLPFKTCSFEILDGTMCVAGAQGELVNLNCIVAHELSPGKVIFFTLSYVEGGFASVKWFHPDDHGSAMWLFLNKMVSELLETLSIGQHGHTSPRTIFKWKDIDGIKQQRRINKVIHVRGRSSEGRDTDTIRNIAWSHSYWVMGHWRTIDGIGKNRDGVYCISGKTWVTAFVKNAELGDPIKKIRLFKGQGEEHGKK